MITQEQLGTLTGRPVHDADGQGVGHVDRLLLDDTTGRPEWARLRSGPSGPGVFIPLREAVLAEDHVEVAFTRAVIDAAPAVGVGGDEVLSVADEQTLFAHYGIREVREQVNADAGTGWSAMDRAQHIRSGTGGLESARTRLRVYDTA
ncbi:PRC-barrel domain-containing protein [Streptomyces sp. NPDC055287]